MRFVALLKNVLLRLRGLRMNKIIAIGFTSQYTCYLNLSREEAMRLYDQQYPDYKIKGQNLTVKEINFDRRFTVYDIQEDE
jgi:hypothetical protein